MSLIFPLTVLTRNGVTLNTPATDYVQAKDVRMVFPHPSGTLVQTYPETFNNQDTFDYISSQSVAQVLAALILAGITEPFVAATGVTIGGETSPSYATVLFAQRHIRGIQTASGGSKFNFATTSLSSQVTYGSTLTPVQLQATAQPGGLQITQFNTINATSAYVRPELVNKEVLWIQYGTQTLELTSDYTFVAATGTITFVSAPVGIIPVIVVYQNVQIP